MQLITIKLQLCECSESNVDGYCIYEVLEEDSEENKGKNNNVNIASISRNKKIFIFIIMVIIYIILY